MVVLSKQVYYDTLGKNVQCSELHWAFGSCKSFLWTFYFNIFIGAVKFVTPITLVQFLLSNLKRKESIHKEFLTTLVRRALFLFCYASVGMTVPCLINKCFGKIDYYDIGFIPGCLGGLFSPMVLEHGENVLYTIMSTSMVFESFFKMVKYYNIFRITDTNLTMLFMLNNAALMYLFTRMNIVRKSSLLWIYAPQQSKKDDSSLRCQHAETCARYCISGMIKYFILGYGWNISKKIMDKIPELWSKPEILIKIFTCRKSIYTGSFFGSYVGLYRLICCYLGRKTNLEKKYHPLLAGLLSGISFGIQPNIPLLCLAVTTTLQVLFSGLEDKYIPLKKLPLFLPVFMICQGFLVHERLLLQEICPSYFVHITSIVTNGQIDKLTRTLFQNCIKT